MFVIILTLFNIKIKINFILKQKIIFIHLRKLGSTVCSKYLPYYILLNYKKKNLSYLRFVFIMWDNLVFIIPPVRYSYYHLFTRITLNHFMCECTLTQSTLWVCLSVCFGKFLKRLDRFPQAKLRATAMYIK